jgi:6-pyruvoyltetrahydropterin/6-carboxytetrahydropterin synthase
MYKLAVRRTFIAAHALIGGDWGRENSPNSHRFVLELQLEGNELDRHGFLVDIVDVERHLDGEVERYRDRLLNDLPAFQGLNPSLENFARILAGSLNERLGIPGIDSLTVVLWEDESAWAAFAIRR